MPIGNEWTPTLGNPPATLPGMVRLTLDDRGRLVFFEAEPTLMARNAAAGESRRRGLRCLPQRVWTWRVSSPVDTGVDPARARHRMGGVGGDAREASATSTLRVESSAYRGTPVSFRVLGPWTPPNNQRRRRHRRRFGRWLASILGDVLLIATLVLARKNLARGTR